MILDFTLVDVLAIMAVATGLFLLLILVLRRLMANISFTVNVTINPAQTPLSAIANPLNLTGTVGQPFSADLSTNVSGGTPPYTLSASGTPPDGLSLNGSVLSGTPTTAGTSTLSVSVTDSGV